MIKMYRQCLDTQSPCYWEIWEAEKNKLITIHHGKIGDLGEVQDISPPQRKNAQTYIVERANQMFAKGYKYLDDSDLSLFVIQYSVVDFGTAQDIDKRYHIEELINECLGWTGNGHCDGGDIGSDTMTIFAYVMDVEIALDTIQRELQKSGNLEGAKIGYVEGEEYITIFPSAEAIIKRDIGISQLGP